MNIVQSSLTAPSPPRAEGPEFVQGEWTFQCLGLQLNGTAQLGNTPAPMKSNPALPASKSPIGMGWRIGWVQVNVQEWSWALYRQTSGESATLLNWPNYTALDNGDRNSHDLFYLIRTPYYQELSANQSSGSIEFTDLPIARFKPRQPMSGGDALLSDIGVRQSFVCALVARAPDDALYVLQWIPWYVQWSCEFAPGPAGLVPRKIAARTRAGIGPVQTGVPPILAQVLASARGSTANVLANASPIPILLSRRMDVETKLRFLRARG